MTEPMTGGCLCGAIRYASAVEPLMAGHCHCLDCQKRGGGGHASAFAVPKAALTVTGSPRHYESRSDSGSAVRHAFCDTCGSTLFGDSSGMPDLVTVHAGSLDDPAAFKPDMHIFTSSAQPWDPVDSSLANFAKFPEMPGA